MCGRKPGLRAVNQCSRFVSHQLGEQEGKPGRIPLAPNLLFPWFRLFPWRLATASPRPVGVGSLAPRLFALSPPHVAASGRPAPCAFCRLALPLGCSHSCLQPFPKSPPVALPSLSEKYLLLLLCERSRGCVRGRLQACQDHTESKARSQDTCMPAAHPPPAEAAQDQGCREPRSRRSELAATRDWVRWHWVSPPAHTVFPIHPEREV